MVGFAEGAKGTGILEEVTLVRGVLFRGFHTDRGGLRGLFVGGGYVECRRGLGGAWGIIFRGTGIRTPGFKETYVKDRVYL